MKVVFETNADENDINFENIYVVDKVTNEKTLLEEYMKHVLDQSKHEALRLSVLTATRNFDHRVKMFYKHIVRGKNNRMCIQFYSYRIEFQDRGAAHVHGVLSVSYTHLTLPTKRIV